MYSVLLGVGFQMDFQSYMAEERIIFYPKSFSLQMVQNSVNVPMTKYFYKIFTKFQLFEHKVGRGTLQ